MAEILLIKTISGLKPSDEKSEEALKRFKIGDIVKTKISKPRNIKFHRKYFKLLDVVLENQERYSNTEELLVAVKLKLGLYDTITTLNGKIAPVLHSISFAKMDEIKFSELYTNTLMILADFLQCDLKELDSKIIEFY